MFLDYVIKPIEWEMKDGYWCFKVNIADIINTHIVISEYKDVIDYNSDKHLYKVQFTNCNWCELTDEPCNNYTKFGFETLENAKEWAEKEYSRALLNSIQDILIDIEDYIQIFS